jgi:hypothetical protein
VWCERIQLATASPFDRASRRQGTDFLGDLLKLCDDIRENPEMLSEMRALLHELYMRGTPSRYLREFLPTDDELRTFLMDAEALSVEALLDEDRA